MSSERVLELARGSGALLEGHFLLSSGRHADRYVQCARLLMDPARAEELALALAERVRQRGLRPTCVIGPALGAVVWAHEVARALGTRALFSERPDGEMVLRRGFELEPDEACLVVEDVVTTGGSAREVVDLVRRLGARPVAVGAVVDRSSGRPFADLGLELLALARIEVPTWTAADCPRCAAGEPAPVKPGSRAAPASPTESARP